MAHHNRIAAMQFTLGLAMRAKLGVADTTALRLAVIAINKTFGAEDPLRMSLKELEDRWPRIHRNPPDLQKAGDALFDAVRRASWPAPGPRADIEG